MDQDQEFDDDAMLQIALQMSIAEVSSCEVETL
jgi:hypothetical protein